MSMKRSDRVRRNEVLLLPECLDDYISADNEVRVLDAYIEKLDLGSLGFRLKAEHTVGSPVTFERPVLLKLLVYGYLNQIRSSRRLERETQRNLEVIWLTEKAQPDHWTINEFRKVNFKAFKALMREFQKVCLRLGLFGKELQAIDGSFFRAQNGKSNNWTKSKLDALEKKIDTAIEAYGQALEDAQETDEADGEPAEVQCDAPAEENAGEQEQAEEDESEAPPKNLRAEGTLEELRAKFGTRPTLGGRVSRRDRIARLTAKFAGTQASSLATRLAASGLSSGSGDFSCGSFRRS